MYSIFHQTVVQQGMSFCLALVETHHCQSKYHLIPFSLVPQWGLVCEECPLGLNAFLSTRPPKGLKNIVILNKSDGELHEIMIKSRGHSVHTGRSIEPTVLQSARGQVEDQTCAYLKMHWIIGARHLFWTFCLDAVAPTLDLDKQWSQNTFSHRLTFDPRPWPTVPGWPGSRSIPMRKIMVIGQTVQSWERPWTDRWTLPNL